MFRSRPALALLLVALLGCPDKTLDVTTCDGTVLSDSGFADVIVRDQRDASYGALGNRSVRPLGGGEGYGNIVPRPKSVVRTAGELRSALGGPVINPFAVGGPTGPKTIYIDDDAEIDLSYCAITPTPAQCVDPRSGPGDDCSRYSLVIPAHTIIASGRGRAGSRGARLFSRTFTGCALFDIVGSDVRLTGLRIHGPDPSIENDELVHCDGESRAIALNNRETPFRRPAEIDNNEMSAWPIVIDIIGIMGVQVHHNVIQFNRRHEHNNTCGDAEYGLGYGVVVAAGSATITANVFDHNRHDIASSYDVGSQYIATYNLVLAGAVQHSFDVHGGKDRRTSDCTNVAGSAFVVHHNTFLQAHKPALRVRGIPLRGAWVYKNETRDDKIGDAFNQVNAVGRFHVTDNRTNVNHFPAWFISFGGSTFWQWRQFEGQDVRQALAGDFNGDGAADVMRARSSGWEWSRSALDGWAFLNTNKDPVSKIVVADVIGNTLSDIVRATGSEWQVSDGGTTPWRTLVPQRASLTSAAFGDFEGDAKADAFFADGTQWTIIQSYSPLVRRHHVQPFKLSQLRFGNFVGDSKLDVVRSTGSEWLVWDRVSRTWNHLNSSSFPLSDLVFADFDGNSVTDIARSTSGQWFVSWDGRSPWELLNTSDLGLKSQLIADFNGDRKADVLSRQTPDR